MEICGPQPQIPPYRPEPEPESGAGGGGGQSDIDLSLPITSTYLRKMRGGGNDMMQFWSTTPQQVGLFFIFSFFSRKSISELMKSEDRNLYFSHFVRYFITNVEDIYLHLKGCFYKKNCLFYPTNLLLDFSRDGAEDFLSISFLTFSFPFLLGLLQLTLLLL